jgi:hypothetical protein
MTSILFRESETAWKHQGLITPASLSHREHRNDRVMIRIKPSAVAPVCSSTSVRFGLLSGIMNHLCPHEKLFSLPGSGASA